jgi:hypothetical protein
MQSGPVTQPPQILQVYRDFLKPGTEAPYREIEEDAARICARLNCPNPYLALESLTGPKEVWYLNGYPSTAVERAVADAYRNNVPLMTALESIPKRKAGLILTPVEVRAVYRADLTRDTPPWHVGEGRFLVITLTKGSPRPSGTVFEAKDGTQFIISSARSRQEADAKATHAGSGSRVFAVRPSMSMPAPEWIGADPTFWQLSPRD